MAGLDEGLSECEDYTLVDYSNNPESFVTLYELGHDSPTREGLTPPTPLGPEDYENLDRARQELAQAVLEFFSE